MSQEKIPFQKAIWEGYMDQKEYCENCSKVLDKRKDEIVEFIYYEKGDIKEEIFFCSPMHLVFWCVQNNLIPSDIELIAKSIIKKAEEKLELKKKQPGTCLKCGADNIEVYGIDCGVCYLRCLNCEETWTEPHEEG